MVPSDDRQHLRSLKAHSCSNTRRSGRRPCTTGTSMVRRDRTESGRTKRMEHTYSSTHRSRMEPVLRDRSVAATDTRRAMDCNHSLCRHRRSWGMRRVKRSGDLPHRPDTSCPRSYRMVVVRHKQSRVGTRLVSCRNPDRTRTRSTVLCNQRSMRNRRRRRVRRANRGRCTGPNESYRRTRRTDESSYRGPRFRRPRRFHILACETCRSGASRNRSMRGRRERNRTTCMTDAGPSKSTCMCCNRQERDTRFPLRSVRRSREHTPRLRRPVTHRTQRRRHHPPAAPSTSTLT